MKMNEKNVVQSNKMGKLILEYALWTVIALILGIGYMYLLSYLIAGPTPEETSILSFVYSKMHFFGVFFVGGIIGAILAILFILFDLFYLKKKCNSSKYMFLKRGISMLLILVILAFLHYFLEKILDVI
ncbi:MAG: hypothetical protein ACNI25_08120 [Halarcobacter sp.]